MNLIDVIGKAVTANPDATAFIYRGNSTSYRDFYQFLCSFAKGLHVYGIKPGDTVAVSLGYDPLHCITVLALARLGAISVPMASNLGLQKKHNIIERFGVSTILTFNEDSGIEGFPLVRLAKLPLEGNLRDFSFTDFVPEAATPYRMSLTSGKTGEPKGELLTHGYQIDRISQTLHDCGRESRVMPFTLHHPMGLTIALGVLSLGGTLVFSNDYEASDMASAMALHEVSHVFVSPVMARDLIAQHKGEDIAYPLLRHLRIVGGAPTANLLAELRERLTPNIFLSYGLTELGPVAMATPEILRAHPRSSGKILPWVRLEVVDEAGVAVPQGAVGELRVQIEGIPTAYHGDEEATRKKFRDGWFYTGDLGRVDEDGLLFIESRLDDVINLGGPKVNLTWVEEILGRHPQVAEAVAFALSDDTGAPFMAAAIMARGRDVDMKQIADYAKEQIGWARPKALFLVPEFPRNVSGKILRAEVTNLAERVRKEELLRRRDAPPAEPEEHQGTAD
ncbi:MAG TPA: class I adenylate-forming enzyme family protein [Burkholderiaceae bacterium]|jgi:acyl-coenzyme A synthetase/AMP-(fatty) acid ligase